MKLLPSILSIVLVSFCLSSMAQSSIKYSSPEASGYEPVPVELSKAKTEASSVAGVCGYSSAFYTRSDIQYLMDLSQCVGIRIYNGKDDAKQTYCEVIAVAVDENGKEIGHFAVNKYMHVQPFDSDQNCTAKKVSKSFAKGCVQVVADDKVLNYQKVFFSKAFVDQRLAISNSTGIAVIPGTDSTNSSMMMAAAKLEDGKITEMEENYFRSQLPCPVDCGETDNYLVPPK